MTELKTLTLIEETEDGTESEVTYDSFLDQKARGDIEKLKKALPSDKHINGLINEALGVIENGVY